MKRPTTPRQHLIATLERVSKAKRELYQASHHAQCAGLRELANRTADLEREAEFVRQVLREALDVGTPQARKPEET